MLSLDRQRPGSQSRRFRFVTGPFYTSGKLPAAYISNQRVRGGEGVTLHTGVKPRALNQIQ